MLLILPPLRNGALSQAPHGGPRPCAGHAAAERRAPSAPQRPGRRCLRTTPPLDRRGHSPATIGASVNNCGAPPCSRAYRRPERRPCRSRQATAACRRGVRLSIHAKARLAAFRRHDQQKGRPNAAYIVTKTLKAAAFRIEMGWSVPAPMLYPELRRAGEAWVHAGRYGILHTTTKPIIAQAAFYNSADIPGRLQCHRKERLGGTCRPPQTPRRHLRTCDPQSPPHPGNNPRHQTGRSHHALP
jgi:hypothetical protein